MVAAGSSSSTVFAAVTALHMLLFLHTWLYVKTDMLYSWSVYLAFVVPLVIKAVSFGVSGAAWVAQRLGASEYSSDDVEGAAADLAAAGGTEGGVLHATDAAPGSMRVRGARGGSGDAADTSSPGQAAYPDGSVPGVAAAQPA